MIKINVKGAIIPDEDKWVYDMLDMPSTSPKDVTSALESGDGKDVELTINSGGGDVFSASEIYTELRSYKGNVKARITGISASAATVISSAADTVEMSPTSSYMIHKASTVGVGNSDDFKHASEFLNTIDESICNAYIHKTGMEQDEILDLMQKATWMSANEAKEKGFIDTVMFEQVKAVASASGALPDKVVNLLRNQQQDNTITIEDIKSVVAEMKEDIVKELKDTTQTKNKKTNNWLF